MLGHDVGGTAAALRGGLSDDELAAVRSALEAQDLLERVS